MKKLLFLIITIFFVGIFFISKQSDLPKNKQAISRPSNQQPAVVNSPNSSSPLSLQIPKLKINTTVESVGKDVTGAMDVPKNADNVAWYNLGYHIGENGSAVIAGHFDKISGAPAVFYHLGELQKGDTIIITMSDQRTVTYAVTKIATYKHDTFPLEEVFNTSGTPRLNIITCDGVWNKDTNLYSQRLVVYTQLVQ